MKIIKIALRNIAGYNTLTWDGIQPNLNFLLGPNGVGKSTALQSLHLGLNYLRGQRTEDLLTRTYPNGVIEIELTDIPKISLSFLEIRESQGRKKPQYSLEMLYSVENRQPKNTMGHGRNELRQHPMNRYPNALSELKALLDSNDPVATQVLDLYKEFKAWGRPEDWDWIKADIQKRGSSKARSVSCGQFDILALLLDVVRLKLKRN